MNDTVFYVLGISLVLVALGVSFGGLRFEKFPPSRGILVGGTLAIAVLVGATMTFAWRNAEDEQSSRDAELASEAATSTTATTSTTSTNGTTSTTTTASVDGSQVFESAGCSGCHTLAAAGSTATTGPDLDAVLKGKTADFIKMSIVDPNAEIANGYPPDVMPQDFGTRLSTEDIDAVVQYLVDSTQ
jgi:mono/diheme cytochrome c family protein